MSISTKKAILSLIGCSGVLTSFQNAQNQSNALNYNILIKVNYDTIYLRVLKFKLNFCMADSRGFTVVVTAISHTGLGVISEMSNIHVIPD